jgi:uncharacterized protein YhbP (UPF0306 family)
MSVDELLHKYLPSANVMQLATSVDNQPWVCTVHFYSDEAFNFYWLSTPERRHSQEISQNQKAAAAILIHENTPSENYIIGISIEGKVDYLGQDIDKDLAKAYTEKLHKDPNLIPDILSGKNPHRFYCLKPANIVMFNTKDFADKLRQELSIKD